MSRDRPPKKRMIPRAPSRFTCHPLTPSCWDDLVRLFGERGACGGCWCMWPRLRGPDYARGKGASNRRTLRRLVGSGTPPGLLAYVGGEPAAWCALGPREQYLRIESSRTLRRLDDRPVWSVVCFFVARPFRHRGLTVRLLKEAVRYARSRGATLLEGYPVEPTSGKTADVWAWHGLASGFRAAGFVEAARPSRTRPIMRRELRHRVPKRRAPKRRSAVQSRG